MNTLDHVGQAREYERAIRRALTKVFLRPAEYHLSLRPEEVCLRWHGGPGKEALEWALREVIRMFPAWRLRLDHVGRNAIDSGVLLPAHETVAVKEAWGMPEAVDPAVTRAKLPVLEADVRRYLALARLTRRNHWVEAARRYGREYRVMRILLSHLTGSTYVTCVDVYDRATAATALLRTEAARENALCAQVLDTMLPSMTLPQ